MSRPKKIIIYFNYLIFICFLLQKFYKPGPSLISFPNPKENFPINLLGIIFKKKHFGPGIIEGKALLEGHFMY